MLNNNIIRDRCGIKDFWQDFIKNSGVYGKVLVSARCFLAQMAEIEGDYSIEAFIQTCDVRNSHRLTTRFQYQSAGGVGADNRYSCAAVNGQDKYLSDRFQVLVPQIVAHYKGSFIDQLRCVHFLGMAGREDVMLYPSQTKRLQAEGVARIAGEIRGIPTGFGDFRFNAPSVDNLQALLAVYTKKVESLLPEVDGHSVYDFVSFAQYYFAVLHPFYERCGRTSEDLMYLLFEQVDRRSKRYISKDGCRVSPLSTERMGMINKAVEAFNQKIALHFGLNPEGICKTPDIYKALTETYFPDRFDKIYRAENKRPFYYSHPIPEIVSAYYFLMEALLYDELVDFNLNAPFGHISVLGNHLREKGQKEYASHPYEEMGNISLLEVLACQQPL